MSEDILLKWQSYKALTTHDHFAAKYGLPAPSWAKQTAENNVVIGITNALERLPTNLLAVREDSHHKYSHDLQPGESSPLGNTIDPQIIIGCESYLSALALTQRCDYWTTLVVC